MTGWASAGPSVLASFAASLVEFVEALTVVLAVGVVRGWRSALLGAAAAMLVLAALVLTLGASLTQVPLPLLQAAIGVLLLMFGLRWLRKAVLRQAGVLPLHDEAEAFAAATERLRRQSGAPARALDTVAFATSFKIVMLEGIEVVFIVIALGAGGRLIVPAAAGAGLALAVVVGLGAWLHRPLANVPENVLKLAVGVMLAAFGTFWVGEGLGLAWPGKDLAIVYLIAAFLVLALALVAAGRRSGPRPGAAQAGAAGVAPRAANSARRLPLLGAAAELWRLFVDDGWLAGGILAWVAATWALETQHPWTSTGACAVFACGLLLLLALSVMQRCRVGVSRASPRSRG